MRVRLSAGVGCAVLVALLVIAPSARAAHSQLWHLTQLDSVGQQLSGYPDMQVVGEDDPYEWGQVLGLLRTTTAAGDIVGYARILALPGSYGYQEILIGPQEWQFLVRATDGDWSDIYDEAFAVLTLIHESYHYRLFSFDEGRVNACAIRDFPTVISNYFGVAATVTQTSQVEHDVPAYKTMKRTAYVTVKGKRVRRVRLVRIRSGVRVTYTAGPPISVSNPVYAGLVADAQTEYSQQPPPYSTGVCS
jgi:hypothetical protein